MKNTRMKNSRAKSRSITVYQRIEEGKRPAKVEILRPSCETILAPDGRVFSRPKNVALLRLPSGTAELREDERTKLRVECGLDEKQMAHVERRLLEQAVLARKRTNEMDILDAEEKVKSVAALAESSQALAKDLRAILTRALHEVEGRMDADDCPADLGGRAPTEALQDTLALINHACGEAQLLYKSLPKGELQDALVLEFQRSWFSYPDMLSTFRNRKCFSRPAGWTGLRAQVLDGRIYKSGDPVSDGPPTSDSDSMPNP